MWTCIYSTCSVVFFMFINFLEIDICNPFFRQSFFFVLLTAFRIVVLFVRFGTRLKEHKKAPTAKRTTNSAFADHNFNTDHEIEWNNASIITCNTRYFQRICLEAWHINNVDDPLNRDDGNLFPEAYRHLYTSTINTGPPVDHSNPWWRHGNLVSKRWVSFLLVF